MLVDLISSNNLATFNSKAAHLMGLEAAVYLNSLIAINDKAIKKGKIDDQGFFRLQRDYITDKTSLVKSKQYELDAKLQNLKILELKQDNKDTLRVDIEMYASLLTAQKLPSASKIEQLMGKRTREEKKIEKENGYVANFKRFISTKNPSPVTELYYSWVESVVHTPRFGFPTGDKVKIFQETIEKYSQGNNSVAASVIKIAISNSYLDANWAIADYEKNKPTNSLRTTQERVDEPIKLSNVLF